MEQWVELEDTYLTNQPLIWSGKGRGRKQIPNPEAEPTEAYLFCFKCKQRLRRVQRSHFMQTIRGQNKQDLERQIAEFVQREDVIVIEDQKKPFKYMAKGAKSQPFVI